MIKRIFLHVRCAVCHVADNGQAKRRNERNESNVDIETGTQEKYQNL